MYSALYLPSRPEGVEDPSRGGFETHEAAEDYVFSQMCSGCQEERKRALAGEQPEEATWWYPNLYPACFCEWIVGLTKEFETAGNFEELVQAGGWGEVIYRKDNTPEENAKLLEKSRGVNGIL